MTDTELINSIEDGKVNMYYVTRNKPDGQWQYYVTDAKGSGKWVNARSFRECVIKLVEK